LPLLLPVLSVHHEKPPPRIRKNLYPQPPSTYRIYFRDFRAKIACQGHKPTKLIKTKGLAFAKEFPPII
jgi:hypothetical protein